MSYQTAKKFGDRLWAQGISQQDVVVISYLLFQVEKNDKGSLSGKSVMSLKTHINSVHKGLKPFKCNECDYSAYRKEHLKCHINTKHKAP